MIDGEDTKNLGLIPFPPFPVGILKDQYCIHCLVKAHLGTVLLVVAVLVICFVGLWIGARFC